MTKTSFLLFSLLSIFVFVSAQDESVELILEEFEGGYIIVNWEDTIVYLDESEQEQIGEPSIPDVEELILEEAGEGLVVGNWEDSLVYGKNNEKAKKNESKGFLAKKGTKNNKTKKTARKFRGAKKNH